MRRVSGILTRPAFSVGASLLELILVLVVVGILSAIGLRQMLAQDGTAVDAFQARASALLRAAQKAALAQQQPVFVHLQPNYLSACFSANVPCPAGSQVRALGASRSADSSAVCLGDQLCEAVPNGVSYTVNADGVADTRMRFDAQGRPFATAGALVGPLTLRISSANANVLVSVANETGYVYP